ncbi:MAG TPA: hypothetical protein VMM76_05700 [Pirellulaceae bacterium]|nr:hypothetical protein [Pirellulaceae bacterium]
MTVNTRNITMLTALVVVASLGGPTAQEARASESCCSSKSRKSSSAGAGACGGDSCSTDRVSGQRRNDPPFQAPHGGQLTKRIWNTYEVVYGPHETRVYLYDPFRSPVSARGIQGGVVMRVRSNGGEFRYPLQYASVSGGHDYLVSQVDLTRVRDGDMDVYFELANLPNRDEPSVSFSQVFAMSGHANWAPGAFARMQPPSNTGGQVVASMARPAVAVADARAADRPAVERQGICPVMKTPLGAHGTPVKVSVNGRSLFVCCRGCIDKVVQNPDLYFQKASSAQIAPGQPHFSRLPTRDQRASGSVKAPGSRLGMAQPIGLVAAGGNGASNQCGRAVYPQQLDA